MMSRWRQGDPLGVEAYLELHPWLLDQPETVLELIAEEMSLQLEAGQEPQPDDFAHRFPLWERQVRALVECHRLLTAQPVQFPSAGENLGEFRLLQELGRGAQGRVFLAAQRNLADRTVVLKLIPRLGDEHLALSRLLHSNIVPLYAVFDFPQRGLRGLCQPFFGGATLAELLEVMRSIPVDRRHGADLIRALTQAHSQRRSKVSAPGLARNVLAGMTYVQAVCWLAACLAEALHHAHGRGLLHLDLKPSNVLLAADGQPMLLDFHLARPPLALGDMASARLGGTPGYMSPEQESALAAAMAGQSSPVAVDPRADVYALGVLLYELLGDKLPPTDAAGLSLQQLNPHVTRGLSAIIQCCLATDPAARYRTARALAEDLHRYLADLPLEGVADRNLLERWRKWRRRRPLALPLIILLAVAAVGLASWGTRLSRQHQAAESAAREGDDFLHQGRYAEALHAFKYGIALVDGAPFSGDLSRRLQKGTAQAERQLLISELHSLVEQLRPLDSMDWLPAERIEAAEQQCQRLWEIRTQIAESASFLAEEPVAQDACSDLLDLGILYANLHARLGRPDVRASRQRSLTILAQAEEICGPSCVLLREQANHARIAGQPKLADAYARQADKLPPRSAWEHYALGRAYARSGDWRQAIGHYDRALALEPQSLWAQFARGLAAYQLGEFAEAHLSFSICMALAPSDGICVYNRGRSLAELGQLDRAAADFNRAAQLAPSLASLAALSRADVLRRKQQFDQALAELEQARAGVAPAVVAYHAALIHLDRQDYAASEASLRESLRLDPNQEQAQRLLEKISLTR
jgi:serine/threonine protein kinase/Tfp pilus assembly protein PilF